MPVPRSMSSTSLYSLPGTRQGLQNMQNCGYVQMSFAETEEKAPGTANIGKPEPGAHAVFETHALVGPAARTAGQRLQ